MVAAALIALGATPAAAQDGVVRGSVSDSAGVPVAGADVTIASEHLAMKTDAKGAFVFSNVPRGSYDLAIRHLGYKPEIVKVAVNDMSYSYDVTLAAQPMRIAGVTVTASEASLKRSIDDFYKRRQRGMGGYFFTRQEIETRQARTTSDVLRATPGLSFVRTRGGNGIRFVGSASDRRACVPTIWLDGQEADDMEIDEVPVSDVEGIEIYSGPSTTPVQFTKSTAKDACGTIVIWTRPPGGASQ